MLEQGKLIPIPASGAHANFALKLTDQTYRFPLRNAIRDKILQK